MVNDPENDEIPPPGGGGRRPGFGVMLAWVVGFDLVALGLWLAWRALT